MVSRNKSVRFSRITAMILFSTLVIAAVATSQQATTTNGQIDVAQIPRPQVDPEVRAEVEKLLESLPPVRMGWLDSYPTLDGMVYFDGNPFDQFVVDLMISGTEAAAPTEPMWPGLRRKFPPEVKERILALQPASIDALLSIMIEDIETPFLEVRSVLVALWDRLSPQQKDMYLRHHVQPYFEMKPRYEKGANVWMRAGFEARLSWPTTKSRGIPAATTKVFLDGEVVKEQKTRKNGSSYGEGIERVGQLYNMTPISISELGLGKHGVRTVTDYEFVCEGRTYTGTCDSGDRIFEVIQPFMPNQLAAEPDREIDRLVRSKFVVTEIDPQPIWSQEENELIAWAPQLVTGPGGSEGYAIHMPVSSARGLPVDLAFEVEYHLLDNGDVIEGSPKIIRKEMGGTGAFSFRPANPNLDRQKFMAGREGFVPLRIVLTPSEEIAKHQNLKNYYDRPIVVDGLRARVHRFDLDAVNKLKGSLEAFVAGLQSDVGLSERQANQFLRIVQRLERGSASGIINLRNSPENIETAVVPFLVRLLDVPEVGFMDSIPRTAMAQLVWIGSPAVDALAEAINSESAQTRRYAALGLKGLAIPKAHDALLTARASADAEVRAIASSVENMPDQGAVVDIPDPVLRSALLRALRKSSGEITRQEIAEARLTRLNIDPVRAGAQVTRCKSLEGIQACRDLTGLYIGENDLKDIGPVSALAKLTSFHIGRGNVTDFSPLQLLERLERLHIEHNPVANFESIGNLTSLRYEVELIGLGVGDVGPLSKLVGVSTLRLQDNGITDITPLAEAARLNMLDLSGNPVRNLRPLSKLERLERLNVSGTDIEDVRFVRDMSKLKLLDIGHTAVKDLGPIAEAPRLAALILDGLAIDNLDAIASPILTSVSFSDTQVADLRPLQRLPKLKGIRASNARIRDISPIASMLDLVSLNLRGNLIEDIHPVAGLTKLTTLNLSDNLIADARPIGALTELIDIDLSDNRITQIPLLNKMSKLRQIQLYNNRIVDIEPLLSIPPNAQSMFVNNLLDCESIDEHIPALEARGVHVLYSGFCISSVEPKIATAGDSVRLTIGVHGTMGPLFYPVGDGGENPRSVYLSRQGADDIQATNISKTNMDVLECTFPLGTASPGVWDLHIDISERKRGVLIGGFTIR